MKFYFVSYCFKHKDGDGLGNCFIEHRKQFLSIPRLEIAIGKEIQADKVVVSTFQEISREMYEANKNEDLEDQINGN